MEAARKRLGEDRAVRAAALSMLVAFVSIMFSRSLWQLLVALLPACAGGVVLATLNTAQLTTV